MNNSEKAILQSRFVQSCIQTRRDQTNAELFFGWLPGKNLTNSFLGSLQHWSAPADFNFNNCLIDLLVKGTTQYPTLDWLKDASIISSLKHTQVTLSYPEQAILKSEIDDLKKRLRAFIPLGLNGEYDGAYSNSGTNFSVAKTLEMVDAWYTGHTTETTEGSKKLVAFIEAHKGQKTALYIGRSVGQGVKNEFGDLDSVVMR